MKKQIKQQPRTISMKAIIIAVNVLIVALVISIYWNSHAEDYTQFICRETAGMKFENENTPEKVKQRMLEQGVIVQNVEVKMVTTPARLEEYRQEEAKNVRAYMWE